MTADAVAGPQSSTDRPLSAVPSSNDSVRFYELMTLASSQPGALEIVAGGTITEMQRRGWPTELPSGSTRSADDVIELAMFNNATFDACLAAGLQSTRHFIRADRKTQILRAVDLLTEEWGNVYCSVSLYGKVSDKQRLHREKYSRGAPLDGRLIVADDVSAATLAALPLPPSWANETSPANYQIGYLFDSDESPSVLVELANRLAVATGGDASGKDRQQLIRWPGTLNTKAKYGSAWRVRLALSAGTIYSLAQFDQAFPMTAPTVSPASKAVLEVTAAAHPRSPAPTVALAHIAPDLQLRANLTPGGAWLRTDGTLRRLPADHFTASVLRGTSQWIDHASGKDASYSGWRYNLIESLWLYGFPDSEIRVLADHLAGDDQHKRGTIGLWADIERCISWVQTHRTRRKEPTPTRGLISTHTPAVELLPRARRARTDRPGLAGGANELLQRYSSDPTICDLAQTDRAKVVGVSLATIKRLEGTLEEQHRIDVQLITTAKGRATRIILLHPDVEPTPPDSMPEGVGSHTTPKGSIAPNHTANPDMGNTPRPPAAMPQSAPTPRATPYSTPSTSANPTDASHAHDEMPTTAGAGAGVLPPSASMALWSELRTVIREAFEIVPRLYPNAATGVLGNVTVKRVRAYVEAAGYVCDAATIAALMQEERHRREAFVLKALSFDGLRAQLRQAEDTCEKITKQGGDDSYWRVRIDLLRAELRQRPPQPELVRKQRRKGGPARPDQRAAAKQYELDLLDQVDAVLGRGRVRT